MGGAGRAAIGPRRSRLGSREARPGEGTGSDSHAVEGRVGAASNQRSEPRAPITARSRRCAPPRNHIGDVPPRDVTGHEANELSWKERPVTARGRYAHGGSGGPGGIRGIRGGSEGCGGSGGSRGSSGPGELRGMRGARGLWGIWGVRGLRGTREVRGVQEDPSVRGVSKVRAMRGAPRNVASPPGSPARGTGTRTGQRERHRPPAPALSRVPVTLTLARESRAAAPGDARQRHRESPELREPCGERCRPRGRAARRRHQEGQLRCEGAPGWPRAGPRSRDTVRWCPSVRPFRPQLVL